MSALIKTNTNEITQAGIYDIPNEIYHSSPGISNSGMTHFLKSPRHYYDIYLNPNKTKEKESKSMIIGKAFHTMVLEPHLFSKQYILMPYIDRRTKAGKEEYSEFLAQSEGKSIIDEEIKNTLENMYISFKEHPLATKLLENSQLEKSFYWFDDETQVMCKTRPDILNDEYIADLKTTDSIIEADFKRSIYKYAYHRQAALGLDGVNKVLNKNISMFLNICIETSPPHYVAIYHQCDLTIEHGRKEYKDILSKFKDCLEFNLWPGLDDIKTISLPNYAFNY